MSHEAPLQPYIENAQPLTAEAVDSHVANRPIAYYGIMPEGTSAEGRDNHPPIVIEDESGPTDYSVLISGDLSNVRRVLVRPMSWSEHPGRGFEALREATISDRQDDGLAVVGVSFPGAGLNSVGMTAKQRESLRGKDGDFSYIGNQQWRAVLQTLGQELASKGLTPDEVNRKIAGYEYILAGSSQGASNTVGLLQSAPEGIVIPQIGLIQNTGWEHTSRPKFAIRWVQNGSKHFGDYTAANPYNDYPALGPGHNTAANIVRNPNSHIGAVVGAMARGGDVDHILSAVQEQERHELLTVVAAAGHDGLSPPEVNKRAATVLAASGLLVRTVVWEGHYHPVMENLANAKAAFREVAKY
jgi:hypothetical protein